MTHDAPTADDVRALASLCSNRFGLLGLQPNGDRFIDPIVAAVLSPGRKSWAAARFVYIAWGDDERMSLGRAVERYSDWSGRSAAPSQAQLMQALRAVVFG